MRRYYKNEKTYIFNDGGENKMITELQLFLYTFVAAFGGYIYGFFWFKKNDMIKESNGI